MAPGIWLLRFLSCAKFLLGFLREPAIASRPSLFICILTDLLKAFCIASLSTDSPGRSFSCTNSFKDILMVTIKVVIERFFKIQRFDQLERYPRNRKQSKIITCFSNWSGLWSGCFKTSIVMWSPRFNFAWVAVHKIWLNCVKASSSRYEAKSRRSVPATFIKL